MVKIAFIHPDLGIGGAERLFVDAAVSAQQNGHSVYVLTTHHDENHCFIETKDGTLSVHVVGDWIPRNIFGKFCALFMYIRMIYAAIYLIFFTDVKPDVVFCDLVSVCIPVLRWKIKRVIFYCHFPDQLLSQNTGMIKQFYRIPLNFMEEITTGMADVVLVNSLFTRQVFENTFKRIAELPEVLYPSVNTAAFDSHTDDPSPNNDVIFLSINRYERKKQIDLALFALHHLKSKLDQSSWSRVKLIIAGGFDSRVNENFEYHKELHDIAERLSILDNVTLLKSPSENEKISLYKLCRAVLYTPSNEHFGIVPLEAMYCKRPVIAVKSGGPMETIEDNVTGFLCLPNAESFADAMYECFNDVQMCSRFGQAGCKRFETYFSFNVFSRKFNEIICKEVPSE